jgi:hypothetical protein
MTLAGGGSRVRVNKVTEVTKWPADVLMTTTTTREGGPKVC